jgi:nucleoside-diphosphate-sugar epimerase
MRVLITGTTGFVGGHVLRRLDACRGAGATLHLVATARRPLDPVISAAADDYVPADLAESMPSVLADVCVHAAGLADDRSPVQALRDANVAATRHVLESLRDCRLFILISSASVYGPAQRPLREEDATAATPQSDYGRTKWEAEECARAICRRRGIDCVVLRPRAIYGPGDRVLLPRLRRLMRPPWLLMAGNGEVPMSLTYIGHLAALVSSIVLSKLSPGSDVFNVSDAPVYQLRAVLSALYTATYHDSPRVFEIPTWILKGYVSAAEAVGRRGALTRQSLSYLTEPCLLDCTRARDRLGYSPSTSLFDHLQATCAPAGPGD